MASKQCFKGEQCELLVAFRLCGLGLIPFLPLLPGSAVDLIVESPGRFHRIQVKSWVLKGEKAVRLERSGNKDNKRKRSYSEDEVNWIAVVRLDDEEVFLIPVKDGRASISISDIQRYREAWDLLW